MTGAGSIIADIDGINVDLVGRTTEEIVDLGIALEPTGLPIGVQIVGPYLEDRTPIVFAALLEREFGGFKPPPGFS